MAEKTLNYLSELSDYKVASDDPDIRPVDEEVPSSHREIY